MNHYVLVSGQDPTNPAVWSSFRDLAGRLASNHQVTAYLIDNAVLAARPSELSGCLGDLHAEGVRILCDDFALHLRGIDSHRLVPTVSTSTMEDLLDTLEQGAKIIWY